MTFFRRYLSLLLICSAALFFVANLTSPFFRNKEKKKTRLSLRGEIPKQYKPFVVAVIAQNPGESIRKNLISIAEQKYPNFRLIFVDNGSIAQEARHIQALLEERTGETVYIRNEVEKGHLQTLIEITQLCRDEEILVFMEGKDWLAHDQVLAWLNGLYEDPHAWMTYGSYLEYPTYKKSQDKEIAKKIHRKGNYRKVPVKRDILPSLRTGYAGFFKQVVKEMSEEGDFFLLALEMARTHAHYVRDVLYIANVSGSAPKRKPGREWPKAHVPHSPLVSWREMP